MVLKLVLLLIRPACSLFTLHRYQGYVSAALVLGGVDVTGPHLFTVRNLSAHMLTTGGVGLGIQCLHVR